MPNRALISFQQMQGREYRLLFPYCNDDGTEKDNYRFSDYKTMSRGLNAEYMPLPAGEYYCSYTVTDIFWHEYRTELVKLYWDGQRYTLAE